MLIAAAALLLFCRLHPAMGQLVVIAVILAACVIYTRNHVSSMERADFSDLEYFEDSKAGGNQRAGLIKTAEATTCAVAGLES